MLLGYLKLMLGVEPPAMINFQMMFCCMAGFPTVVRCAESEIAVFSPSAIYLCQGISKAERLTGRKFMGRFLPQPHFLLIPAYVRACAL